MAANSPVPDQDKAICPICPHACILSEGRHGICRARIARDGAVVDENYGRITSLALDPMEKKPLARFLPGTFVLSVGSYGCNLRCPFCQNASIACAGAEDVPWRTMRPADLVAMATLMQDQGAVGIAYTYNEPFVGFEFVRDAAQLAHENGLLNVVVSNGMVNQEPLAEVLPFIDAANIDLKGFSQEVYDVLGGDFATVKRSIEAIASCASCHLEITTLVVPGLNDDEDEIAASARWVASLDPSIPFHLTRFYPCHRMADRPPTATQSLRRLATVAGHYLADVLVGS